jgi:serine/threonine protein kinase
MNTPEPSSARDPVERLAESFLERYRRGERPGLAEYVERYPELADDIRDLFPARVEMEGLRSDVDGPPGWSEPREPAAAEAEPQQLGDYRILRVLGAGGMGIVYEAERQSLRLHVALKVRLRRYRDHSGFLRRFHNEARSAARLHHTNIVPVFDFGEQDGILYYAMQYIPGQGLDRVLDDVRRLR